MLTTSIAAINWPLTTSTTSAIYAMLMIAGLVASTLIWQRTRQSRQVPALVYVGALIGAVLGAKLGYLLCEAPFIPRDENLWPNLLIGRTILGGLFGGYLGVEWGKHISGYMRPTGDIFALATPLGIAMGRIGCMIHGCCPGRRCDETWYSVQGVDGLTRLPASTIEMLFQLVALSVLAFLYRRQKFPGQLFHLYLMAYALFRIMNEALRETPRIPIGVTTYQLLAGGLFLFAFARFRKRNHATLDAPEPTTGT